MVVQGKVHVNKACSTQSVSVVFISIGCKISKLFKGIVYQIYLRLFLHCTDLEKCSSTSLAHQWILCREWLPSECVQTADKNITVIHTIPIQLLTSCEAKLHVSIQPRICLKLYWFHFVIVA